MIRQVTDSHLSRWDLGAQQVTHGARFVQPTSDMTHTARRRWLTRPRRALSSTAAIVTAVSRPVAPRDWGINVRSSPWSSCARQHCSRRSTLARHSLGLQRHVLMQQTSRPTKCSSVSICTRYPASNVSPIDGHDVVAVALSCQSSLAARAPELTFRRLPATR